MGGAVNKMKKRLTFITTCLMAVTIFTSDAKAATPVTTQTEIICQNNDIRIESALTVFKPLIQPFSNTQTKKAQKTLTIKDTNKSVATFTLTATFSHDQETATCTNTGYQSSIIDSAWSFTSRSTSRNGNKAYGLFTVKSSSKSISDTVTITCSPNGTIS